MESDACFSQAHISVVFKNKEHIMYGTHAETASTDSSQTCSLYVQALPLLCLPAISGAGRDKMFSPLLVLHINYIWF
jgi:hypothetical protein